MKAKKRLTVGEIVDQLAEVLNKEKPNIITAYGAACAFAEMVRQQYIVRLIETTRENSKKGGAA